MPDGGEPESPAAVPRVWSVWDIDITALQRAGAQPIESEARFRVVFDLANIGMALVRPDGSWLKVNRALCRNRSQGGRTKG